MSNLDDISILKKAFDDYAWVMEWIVHFLEIIDYSSWTAVADVNLYYLPSNDGNIISKKNITCLYPDKSRLDFEIEEIVLLGTEFVLETWLVGS